jgi:hypothetical protein
MISHLAPITVEIFFVRLLAEKKIEAKSGNMISKDAQAFRS